MKIAAIILGLSLVFILVLSGCAQQQTKYVCLDGSTVSDISLCPKEKPEVKTKPIYTQEKVIIYDNSGEIQQSQTSAVLKETGTISSNLYQGGEIEIAMSASSMINYALTGGANCVSEGSGTTILKKGSLKDGIVNWKPAGQKFYYLCIKLENPSFRDWDNINPVTYQITIREIQIKLQETILPKKQENTHLPQPETKKQCPASCDDKNKCTYDYCDFSTNYECVYQQIQGCCGNNICENVDECVNCFSDCYTCKEHDCIALNNQCKDRKLYIFTTFDGIRIEVPKNYITKAEWFGDIETTTLQKIKQVYGFAPKTPITYRFVEFDLSDYNYVFNPQSNKIIIPAYSNELGLLTLKKYYEESHDLSLLEVHEMVHAVNFANCEYISYSPVGEEHKENKIPLWTDEGLAMMMEIWIPYNYGNSFDKLESRYEPQKDSVIKSFEDKNSNFWKLVNNPTAYGYNHARGSVLLYSWFKYGLKESQIKSFVSNLFKVCSVTNEKVDDKKIIELWNNAVGRDDTHLFKDVEIID